MTKTLDELTMKLTEDAGKTMLDLLERAKLDILTVAVTDGGDAAALLVATQLFAVAHSINSFLSGSPTTFEKFKGLVTSANSNEDTQYALDLLVMAFREQRKSPVPPSSTLN